jgi:anaerobic selenocysteine-containing dehydrogenase
MSRTVFRTCPLCEATCGLRITLDEDRVTDVRGDREDVFSHGFICPKGATLGDLDQDPDRLSGPLIRRDGELVPASWEEAFAEVERGLAKVRAEYGDNAVALYFGNPTAHTMAGPIYTGLLAKSLGTTNVYSATTADQMPKQVACGHLFGDPGVIPVPDLDRTDYLLMLGANPLESNGSVCTAPDFPGRLKALRKRGGTLVVVDPRRTRTADLADEHLFIRPGADALLLFALVQTLFSEDLVSLGDLAVPVSGVDSVRELALPFTPEVVERACGIEAATIRRIARELAGAPTAAVYARMGTCTAEFGTLANWLVDVLNTLTGNLDSPGGVMFPAAANRATYVKRKPFRAGRWRSRVRQLPEMMGELPVATLADEISTPGEGQVRALITIAGNPVLSAPNGPRIGEAMAGLDFMVSVDPYLNETTRHATVILPAPRMLQVGHYDWVLNNVAVRNVANYSPPILPLPPGRPSEAEILGRLVLIASGQRADVDLGVLEETMLGGTLAKAVAASDSPVAGRDPAELRSMVDGRDPLERWLDLMVRLGPYGDGFGAKPEGLRLRTLLDHPHGVDLGPLRPRIGEVVATEDGTVHLCPPEVADDVPRLLESMVARDPGFVLIGRRQLRSNNSWGHNVPALQGGSNVCTLHINPVDADRLGLSRGQRVVVRSRAGEVEVEVDPTEAIMPGVVSLPHGWGHDAPGTRISVASRRAGVNANALTDERVVDPLSGNAVFNGVPVKLVPVAELTEVG